MPDDLRWSWCDNNRNKAYNKYNVIESAPNWSLVPKRVGDTAVTIILTLCIRKYTHVHILLFYLFPALFKIRLLIYWATGDDRTISLYLFSAPSKNHTLLKMMAPNTSGALFRVTPTSQISSASLFLSFYCVSCVQLFANPWTVGCQAPLSMVFSW